jgi:hypothetical protein
MRQATVNVYTYDELNDIAKQKVLDEYLNFIIADLDLDHVKEDFKTICAYMGVTLKEDKRGHLCIYTGNLDYRTACDSTFEGSYECNLNAQALIEAYAPEDKTLSDIAKNLDELQSQFGYKIIGKVRLDGVTAELSDSDLQLCGSAVYRFTNQMKLLKRWLHEAFSNAYEDATSTESMIRDITANGYEFYDNGSLFEKR